MSSVMSTYNLTEVFLEFWGSVISSGVDRGGHRGHGPLFPPQPPRWRPKKRQLKKKRQLGSFLHRKHE